MATLVLDVYGKKESFETAMSNMDAVEKLVNRQAKRGVEIKQIHANVDAKYGMHRRSGRAAKKATATVKVPTKAAAAKKVVAKTAKKAAEPAAKKSTKKFVSPSTRGKGDTNAKRVKAGEIISKMRDAGESTGDILSKLQKDLDISYPNAYYYVSRVFK